MGPLHWMKPLMGYKCNSSTPVSDPFRLSSALFFLWWRLLAIVSSICAHSLLILIWFPTHWHRQIVRSSISRKEQAQNYKYPPIVERYRSLWRYWPTIEVGNKYEEPEYQWEVWTAWDDGAVRAYRGLWWRSDRHIQDGSSRINSVANSLHGNVLECQGQ